jgi:hypothetical protein
MFLYKKPTPIDGTSVQEQETNPFKQADTINSNNESFQLSNRKKLF